MRVGAAPRLVTSAQLLDIDWNYPIDLAAGAEETGRTVAQKERRALPRDEALRALAGDDRRPLLVLRECMVCAGTDEALLTSGADNEKTLLLMRWFHCVKLPPDTSENPNSPFHALFPDNDSAHLFVSRWDGGDLVPLEDETSRTALWKSMTSLLDSSYEGSTRTPLKALAKLLDEYDRLDIELAQERAQAVKLIEKYGSDSSKLRKVERALEALATERAELDAQVRELTELELRAAEPTAAR